MHNDKVVLIEDIEREPDKTLQYKFEGKISELEDCTVDAELEIKSLGDFIEVKGEVSGSLKLECDRCLNKYDYDIDIDIDEIFVSDGAKCDCGNIVDILAQDNKVAITDPVYPVYLDTNVMSGRSGKYDKETGKYENIVYIPATSKNNFVPELPKE